MPEIPDLNIFSINLSKRLVGKKLDLISVIIPRKLKVPEIALKEALEGQKLKSITREGKELYFTFQNGQVLSVHLMLHGTMYWYEGKNEQRFTIAELLFSDGTGLAITDWQKAVILTLDPKLAKLPDAMNMPDDHLHAALKKSSHSIKTVLTEGKVVRGIAITTAEIDKRKTYYTGSQELFEYYLRSARRKQSNEYFSWAGILSS